MKIDVSISITEPKGSYDTRTVAGAAIVFEHIHDECEFKARAIMAGVADAIEDATERIESQLRAVQKSRDALARNDEEEN